RGPARGPGPLSTDSHAAQPEGSPWLTSPMSSFSASTARAGPRWLWAGSTTWPGAGRWCRQDEVLADPFGKTVDEGRPVRDEIRCRVVDLLATVGVAASGGQ